VLEFTQYFLRGTVAIALEQRGIDDFEIPILRDLFREIQHFMPRTAVQVIAHERIHPFGEMREVIFWTPAALIGNGQFIRVLKFCYHVHKQFPLTLDLLIKSDPGRARRQVGIVDAQGRVASYTGDSCQSWAGGVQGLHYSAQGNILTGEEVVRGMGRAFESTRGDLDDRLLAALRAAEAAGGDSRGKQSAAILVVRAKGGYNGMNDRYLDLRVDDNAEPVAELTRIHVIWKFTRKVTAAVEFYQKEEWPKAIAVVEEALAAQPDDPAMRYNLACFCARGGRKADAFTHLAAAIERDTSYRALAAGDADFASLRKDKRWKQLVEDAAQ